ncbi:nuclear matrix constituent protein 1-like isoform X2 [Humulus lupulus]|uniref:nuclear matrix constituent protein 1-like isoform X2 n=1 Tax=Humulus lupulus TaxID=3486 RepID=UPI002B408704|nr:nuclear matrix constituent protein 1-like isoform X2 [Humulus lupulus]
MFTPQRKATEAALSLGPRLGTNKGKAVAFLDGPPPPLGSLSEARATATLESDMGNLDDWRRFKEVGLLDEAVMVRKDHEALAEKVTKLESQLFDYQYNMGLLLIEKEDWTLKFEELRKALAETHEILKREQSAHLIALSEAEKREENVRKALGAEKQCVAELEKALYEMHDEQAEIKLTSASKLAEADELAIGMEEKSLEIEKKLQAADARLAEVNRKSTELKVRFEEVEARESVLHKEQQTLSLERETHKATFSKHQDDLREWEKRLHEREDRLCKDRRTLKEREEKANENERIHKQMEMELEELEKKIDSCNLDMKQKEEDITKRLADLSSKEKEADSLRNILEMKGKELHQLEEKLSLREKIEVQQLLDGHKAILDVKMKELDMEIEDRRKSLDRELSSKVDALGKKEAEINHREEKLGKREHALHEKADRLKEKNKESEEKLKSIKEREKIIKAEEKKLETEKQQMLAEKERVQSLLAKVEKIKAENIQLELQIHKERENLIVTDKERSEHVHLQLELKQEIENYRLQNELLLKEAKDLKQEKENFEKEWEDLDEKRSNISKELRELLEEKENLAKLRHLEEERLNEEKDAVQEFKQREMENIKLEKNSFAAKMTAEQLAISEKAQFEHRQMVQDFELQRRNLETDLRNELEKMEKLLHERERAFRDETERELNNIRKLKEVAQKEMEEVRLERQRTEKQREELLLNKEQLNVNQLEIRNDIDQLAILSNKIKYQREELIKDRSQFLSFVEKLKSCKDGGEIGREFILSDFHVPEVNHGDAILLPSSDDELVEKSSDGLDVSELGTSKSEANMSWLKKCTSKIFKLSPSKKSENALAPISVELPPATEEVNEPKVLYNDGGRGPGIPEDRQPSSSKISNHPVNAQKVQFGNVIQIDDGYAPDHSQLDSKVDEVPEDSLQSEVKSGLRKSGRRRNSGLHRTRSAKAVVEEAKAFLGESLDEPGSNVVMQPSDSYNTNEESRGDSGHAKKGYNYPTRKRLRGQTPNISESEQDGGDSEACSGSVTTGRGRKRQQTVASGLQTPGNRYNFRRRKNVDTTKVDPKKTEEKEAEGSGMVDAAATPEVVSISPEAARKSTQTKQVAQFTTPVDADIDTEKARSGENTEMDNEVNDTSKYGGEDQNGSVIHETDNDYDEDEEELHAGEVSVGKKLWNFFTT